MDNTPTGQAVQSDALLAAVRSALIAWDTFTRISDIDDLGEDMTERVSELYTRTDERMEALRNAANAGRQP